MKFFNLLLFINSNKKKISVLLLIIVGFVTLQSFVTPSFTFNSDLFWINGSRVETDAISIAREMLQAAETGVWDREKPLSKGEVEQMNYILTQIQYAINSRLKYGTPISISLAQDLLESDRGRSALARYANNHFGIKARKDEDWVWEWDNGKKCKFRKFDDVQDSYYGHDQLLHRSHYTKKGLWECANDYKKFAHKLRECGYAEDKNYPGKLIRIIERYHLNVFDNLGEIDLVLFLNALTELKNEEIITASTL